MEFRLSSKNAMPYRASAGKLMKWYHEGKFIKTSSINNNDIKPRFMYESYSEIIVSALCKDLGIRNCVQYKPCKIIIDDTVTTIGCYSESFIKESEEYLSIGQLMEYGAIQLPIGVKAYTRLKQIFSNARFTEMLDNIILLDYVILNCDRHYGNFGVIRKVGGSIKAAPIFDSGDSLFGSKFISGLEYSKDLERYVTARPFSIDFNKQLELVNKRLTFDKSFRYTKDILVYLIDNWELDRERVEFIWTTVQSRASDIRK